MHSHTFIKKGMIVIASFCFFFAFDIQAKSSTSDDVLLLKKEVRKNRNRGSRSSGSKQRRQRGENRNRRNNNRAKNSNRTRNEARKGSRRGNDRAQRDRRQGNRDQARRDHNRRSNERAQRDRRQRNRDQAKRDRSQRGNDRAQRDRRQGNRDQARRDRSQRGNDRAQRDRRQRNRDQARGNRGQRGHDRITRDRVRKDRRSHAKRKNRIRDRQRRNHRKVSRKRFHKNRRHHRAYRRVIRYHYRWLSRYSIWWNNHSRWGHPGWPYSRINYPSQWPDNNNDLWSMNKIVNVSDNLEAQFSHIYNLVYQGDDFNGHERVSEVATAAYELWNAAQVYSDAIEYYSSNLYYSIYELYNLEEKALAFEKIMNHSGVESHVKDHFNVGKFYINELLYQYRRQLGPIDSWRDRIDEGDDWRNEIGDWDDTYDSHKSTTLFFRWNKPHITSDWVLNKHSKFGALTVEASETFGRQGASGVAGVSHIVIHYRDGSVMDLVTSNHSKYSSKSDQIVLTRQGDHFKVHNPYPQLAVSKIEIQADSWLSETVDVGLSITID